MQWAMHDKVDEVIGLVAGVLTTASFVPQVRQSIRTRDLKGISLPMYSLFTLGVALWAAYGLVVRSWSVLIPNVITFVLASTVLLLKLKEK
jgi:MtN3 and saliva related transmembrane protein